ncbi:RagB/SusD family nutrient uptake outer membrane protein [Butyricimonas sp.]|uniref:RagB/SusD family nutrient uptake outer membrane protein n=1 Tax=Butyricimonas sp. TaxID=1969738 RepID=UPI0025BE8111|nr:RagB/SusD family nutrient uptake outer membrane protein [Butyricimonas sp.]
MRKINILYVIIPLLLSACGNWLDVKPSNEVDEEDLFNSGSGYRTALNGIYKDMSSSELWGRELTWGFADVLAQYYYKGNLGNNSIPYNRAVQYLYDDKNLEPLIQNIWSKGYNVIANCNNLIQNISLEDTVKFQEKRIERDMIHGEAIACRGFMHFELLRYFAPSLKEAGSDLYMPYFDKFPSLMESYLSVPDMIKKIEADLLKAREILATTDLLEGMLYLLRTDLRYEGGASSGNAPSDIFFNYRGFRMNYTAVTAALARLYFYADRLEEAADMATEVIDFVDENNNNVFTFTDKSNFSVNTKMYNDLIFALSQRKLTENFEKYDETEDSECHLGMDYDDWEEIAGEDAGDRRVSQDGGLVRVFYDEYYVLTRKYYNASEMNDVNKRIIPVIRLSEMYYIRGEYYASLGQYDQAVLELENVRGARGCTTGRISASDLEEFHDLILEDAKKEFWGEGQLFQFYKKYNVKPTSKANFVLPLPENESAL